MLFEIDDRDTCGYRSFKRNVQPDYALEHPVSKEGPDFVKHRLGILGPFVEKGGEGMYVGCLSDFLLDELDHPQQLANTHKGENAHIDGDDDPADRPQGIEGKEAEAWRTIDDDVFVPGLA